MLCESIYFWFQFYYMAIRSESADELKRSHIIRLRIRAPSVVITTNGDAGNSHTAENAEHPKQIPVPKYLNHCCVATVDKKPIVSDKGEKKN